VVVVVVVLVVVVAALVVCLCVLFRDDNGLPNRMMCCFRFVEVLQDSGLQLRLDP
jgi:hypothetical protein